MWKARVFTTDDEKAITRGRLHIPLGDVASYVGLPTEHVERMSPMAEVNEYANHRQQVGKYISRHGLRQLLGDLGRIATRSDPPRQSSVYFVRESASGFIKIGWLSTREGVWPNSRQLHHMNSRSWVPCAEDSTKSSRFTRGLRNTGSAASGSAHMTT